jgi:hypothetical protein
MKSDRVHLTVGTNIAAMADPVATVHGGLILSNIAECARRPLHVRAMVEFDVFRKDTGVFFPRNGFIGPGIVGVSSTHGFSVETALLCNLRTFMRVGGRRRMEPYAGITTGLYHRVIDQQIWLTLHSTRSAGDSGGMLRPEQLGARTRPMVGALLGMTIPLLAEKSPFYSSAVTGELRYRHLIGNRDLPAGIRRAHQLAFLVSLTWKLW